ncbi:MAG: hypothetical protein V1792_23420 [Pseudomonadota bacterium]
MGMPRWLVVQYYNGEVWELNILWDEEEAVNAAAAGIFEDEEVVWATEVYRLDEPVQSFKNRK